jgi:hypothetical protein
MLASMNLLKSLSAKREAREMLLVKCATEQGSVDHQLRIVRTQRSKGFYGAVFTLTLVLASVFYRDLWRGYTLMLFVAYGVCAFQWELSTRKIQLLRLIKHYREED